MTLTLVVIISFLPAFYHGRASTKWTWAAPTDRSLLFEEPRKPMHVLRLIYLGFNVVGLALLTVIIGLMIYILVAGTEELLGRLIFGIAAMMAFLNWAWVAHFIFRLLRGEPVFTPRDGWI
ncbi:MAG: hypothetical protein AAF714_12435 [Pseudomonadota bacterium]